MVLGVCRTVCDAMLYTSRTHALPAPVYDFFTTSAYPGYLWKFRLRERHLEDGQMFVLVQSVALGFLAAIAFGGIVALTYQALGWLLD